MAELQFPDIGASFRDGQRFGTQQRLLGESEQRRSRLADLAGQAYGASGEQRSALVGQAVGVDPGAGLQLGQDLQSNDDARTKTLVNAAKLLTSAPPEARPGLWQQIYPGLQRLGLSSLPQSYDATSAPTIDQTAQSIVSAYADTGATPAGLREFQGMTAGLSADDVMSARRVHLGLDPRKSSAAIQYKEVVGSDGRTRYVAFDPREVGAQVVGGGDTYGSGVGGPRAAVGSDHLATFQNLAQQFGAQISSTNRSPEHNARVGGVPNSQHLRGTAGDFVVPQQTKAAFVQAARQAGYEAIDEGDHVHLELPPNRQVAQSGAFVSRSPEEQAALTTSATEAAKLQYLPQQEAIKTQAAIQQAGGAEEAKQAAQSRVELAQALPKVITDSQTAIALIDKAINHPGRAAATGASSKFDPRNYAPGTDATNFRVLLDQLKGGTFLQAFQSLKGGGAITQVEGTKAEQAIARLDQAQSDEEFLVALNDLRAIAAAAPVRAQAKLDAMAAPQRGGGGQSAPAVQRAVNPQTGEVLELRNGQWVPAQ